MNTSRWILAALALFASSAQAFIDPPVITPEYPTTETPIAVSIRTGVCDGFLNHTVVITGDAVELRIRKITTQEDPLCNYPIRTARYELPLLPAGLHPIFIYLQDNIPPDSPWVLWYQTTLDVANVGGVPPAPASVPAVTGWFPFTLFLLGVLFLAFRYRTLVVNKHIGVLVLASCSLLVTSHIAHASTWIEVLLSADAESPTVQQAGSSTPSD